jgi:hypothetical protein
MRSEIAIRRNSPAFILRLNALIPAGVRPTTFVSLGDLVEDDHFFAERHCGGPDVSCTVAVCACPNEVVQPMVTLSPGWSDSSSSVSVSADATV